jgi:hypothetical protein
VIGKNCHECEVSLDLIDNSGYDVEVGAGVQRNRVGFGNVVNRRFSSCGVFVAPNPVQAEPGSLTVDLQFLACSSKTNVCRRVTHSQRPSTLTLGSFALTCPAQSASPAVGAPLRRPGSLAPLRGR